MILHFSQESGQLAIKFFKCLTVALWIPAVAVDGIEIDEVRHDDAAISGSVHGGESFLPQGIVSRRPDLLGHAGVGKDITNFSDTDDGASLVDKFL